MAQSYEILSSNPSQDIIIMNTDSFLSLRLLAQKILKNQTSLQSLRSNLKDKFFWTTHQYIDFLSSQPLSTLKQLKKFHRLILKRKVKLQNICDSIQSLSVKIKLCDSMLTLLYDIQSMFLDIDV